MLLLNASAWFLRPGIGSELTAISTPVHVGTTTAVVRTQVTASDGTNVIEVMTQHVLGHAAGHGQGPQSTSVPAQRSAL